MKVTVTSRHVDVTETMKEYAFEKARRLERYFDHARKLQVILDLDGVKGFKAEMIASLVRGQVLTCKSKEVTAMAALDAVVDKMERQFTRFKEKLRGNQARPSAGGSKFKSGQPQAPAGDNVGDIWW
jgi:putative sigma-54 modulation protein